jgi:RNA polymerase sigma-70 factor (ECF subfamily)
MYSLDTPVQGDEEGQPLAHEFAAPDSNPQDIIINPIMDEKLQKALASLPTDYRTAILMCDVEQKSYQEIAISMRCAIGTVRSRIHRARVMLRKQLEGDALRTRSRRSATVLQAQPVKSVNASVSVPRTRLAAA